MAFLSADRLTELLNATMEERSTEVQDAVSFLSPAFDMLRGEFKSGDGYRWTVPVETYSSPDPEEVDNEDAEFTVLKIGQITENASYEWSSIDVSQVTIPYTMLSQNMGKTQVYDLVKQHTESVKRAAAKSMAQRVFATGNHLSVRDLCDPAITVIGEIDSTQTPAWAPTGIDYSDDGSGNPYTSVEIAMEDFDIVRQGFSTGTKGAWVVGRHAWKSLRQSVRERTHIDMLGSDGVTKVGFKSIEVDGNQVSYDPFVADDEALWIETGALECRYLGDDMIKFHEALPMPSSNNTKLNLTKVIPCVSIMSVGTKNRRALGMIKNIPAPTYT